MVVLEAAIFTIICLNFRLFLQDLSDKAVANLRSGILSKLSSSDYLKYFKAMTATNLDWDILSEEYTVEGSSWPIVYMDPTLTLPTAKKRKTK